ncbi:MAG: ABC transporter ATP-binding protein [archaeon]
MVSENYKKRKKIDWKFNSKIYYDIVKPYTWLFVVLVFIVAVTTVARLAERYLFKVVIDNGTSFSNQLISRQELMSILWIVAIVFFTSLIIKDIAHWFQIHVINKLDAAVIFDLKNRFFNHIVYLSHRFHTTHKTGSLISRLTRGSRAIESVTDFLILNLIPVIIQLVIIGGSIFYFDRLSSIILVLTSLVFIAYSLFILAKSQKYSLEANNAEDREKAHIGDTFSNIDSVKYFGKEDKVNSIFHKLSDNTRKKFMLSWNFYRWLDSGQSFILGVGLFFLIYFPLMAFLKGEMTLGTITFIYATYGAVAEPLFGFVWGIRRAYEAMADFQSLFEYAKVTNDIKDSENAQDMKINKGEIEFTNVSFKYNTRKIIDGFNLHVRPNEKVAFVGHSGAGKTTIVKLLYRFYDLDSGKITIDGKDITKFKQKSLRSELSVVPQECILFDDTIYNNILFSRPEATRDEVMRAMKFAQLDKFVSGLPSKENTIVGERGVKLSGGEKQRVSIARAILANRRILVLDEATSSLDSKTEYEIQRDLEELMRGRTTLIIAHRLSTIMRADKIVVISKGKIAQLGNHRDLIRKKGIYKELWNLQKGGYIGE